jgi:eukaryotic-like serine/threonine-protein kinase
VKRQAPSSDDPLAAVAEVETIGALRTSVGGTVVGLPSVRIRRHQPMSHPGLSPSERYEARRVLGHGGMGRVEVVFDRILRREVAEKSVTEPAHDMLLYAEAQVVAQLEHPAIVPVYDAGSGPDGRPRYTMRVVRGRTLREVLDERGAGGALARAQLLGVVRQVALAMDYAHRRGVVHRDLKPANVVVGEFGEVYVLDWGIAHLMPDGDIERVDAGGVDLKYAGTPSYMAPEQRSGGALTPATDVYAMGLTLFEVLAGVNPLVVREVDGWPRAVEEPWARRPTAVDPAAPAVFDALVGRCLADDPNDRPNVRELADAIDAYLDRERERADSFLRAAVAVAEGDGARGAFEVLVREAERLHRQATLALGRLVSWAPASKKEGAWELEEHADEVKARATRALARAQAAYIGALTHVPDHAAARRGLAALYWRQLLDAERDGDRLRATHCLELARNYDDGDHALELADEGRLVVDCDGDDVSLEVARYRRQGLRSILGDRQPAGAHVLRLQSGSYQVIARRDRELVRYPLVIERAKSHRLRLRFPPMGTVPDGMVLVPGGPFLYRPPSAPSLERFELPDFCIGRFPIRVREYVRFLDELDASDLERHMPRLTSDGGAGLCRDGDGCWTLAAWWIEGEARRWVPGDRELDVPVINISWFNARAYCRWLAARTGLSYRLPTDAEWEKAMRGADGRSFPMGNELDWSFAKLRMSRPEAAQPEPVGTFPLDESPYGVRDLAGGVSDWTSTFVDGTPAPADDDPAEAERQAYYRGGNWGRSTLPTPRNTLDIGHGASGLGFRLALSLDHDGSSSLVVEPMKR